MSAAAWIFGASLFGSIVAVSAAHALARVAGRDLLSALVGFALGALLGVAFLEILPHVLGQASVSRVGVGAMLAGIVGFFVLEKLFVWRHHHGGEWESEHDAHAVNAQAPGALLTRIGNAVHNLFDGVFVAATFLTSIRLGVLSALAIFAHELAQQLSDARGALHHGRRSNPLAGALAACAATLGGAWAGWVLLSHFPAALPAALGLTAASMVYVAMADLIPSLHRRTDSIAAMQQIVLIAAGVASVALLSALW